MTSISWGLEFETPNPPKLKPMQKTGKLPTTRESPAPGVGIGGPKLQDKSQDKILVMTSLLGVLEFEPPNPQYENPHKTTGKLSSTRKSPAAGVGVGRPKPQSTNRQTAKPQK